MTLFKAIEMLRLNLNAFIKEQADIQSQADQVWLGNAGSLDSHNSNSPNEHKQGIYLSLVNIQQEFTLSNSPSVKKNDGSLEYIDPPLYLNLSLLISSFYEDYTKSLIMLSYVISYMNSTRTFSFSSRPVKESVDEDTQDYTFGFEEKAKFKFTLDLYSLTFEQINYLWGTLGGKQLPHVLYKMGLIEIDPVEKKKGGGLIQEVRFDIPKV